MSIFLIIWIVIIILMGIPVWVYWISRASTKGKIDAHQEEMKKGFKEVLNGKKK